MKITKTELKALIKEEYDKKVKADKLVKRLDEINSQIEGIVKEDEETLEEVEAGGLKKTDSTGWSGQGGDTKYDEKFEKIGTHLKEGEGIEDVELDVDSSPAMANMDDSPVEAGEELDITSDEPKEFEEEVDLRDLVAKLADAIEKTIEDKIEDKIEGEDENIESKEGLEGLESEEGIESIEPNEPETIEENALEPQAGTSPATKESSASPQKKNADVSVPFTEDQTVIKEDATEEPEETVEEGRAAGVPDGTGPHGKGMGPGKGKADGTGLKEEENKEVVEESKYLNVKEGSLLSEELIRMRTLAKLIN